MPRRSTHAFTSASLVEHLARGLIGLTAIALAFMLGQADRPWWSMASAVALIGIALVAMRGCPTCWAIGLVGTISNSIARLRDTQAVQAGDAPRGADSSAADH